MKKSLFLIASAILAMAACVPGPEEEKEILLPPAVYGTDMFVDVTEYDATFRYTGSAPKVLWRLNTGETFETPTATYTFDTPATYSVKLGVADETTTGWSWSEAHSFTMAVPPKSKKPELDKDMIITSEPSTTQFILNMSYTGEIATMWKWEFEDETVITTKEASRTYTAEGDHSVRLGICDGEGKDWLWSDAYEFTAILSAAPPTSFTAGPVINASGDGVADIDKGHHMTYFGGMDYHTDRNIAAAFSDFCSYKNDAGSNPKAEFFNHWPGMYNEDTDIWETYFDYEIFISLVGGSPLFLHTESGVYVGIKGDFTWKDDSSSAQGHVGGKADIEFYAGEVEFFTVPASGVYRIRFNVAKKLCYVSKVENDVAWWRIWGTGGNKTWDVPYIGKGVFQGTYTGLQNGNDYGSGYKFLFHGFDQDQPYGCQYSQGSTKVFATDPKDKNNSLVPVQGGPWNSGTATLGLNGTFSTDNLNFNNGSYKEATVTIYMNDTYGFYTHTVSLVAK